MTRFVLPLVALGAAFTLTACNATSGGAGPITSAPIGPMAYQLPPGSGCAAEINRYQGVLRADLETGNVDQRVYDDIQRELTRAASACEAGRDGEARGLVSASKAKHGYRA